MFATAIFATVLVVPVLASCFVSHTGGLPTLVDPNAPQSTLSRVRASLVAAYRYDEWQARDLAGAVLMSAVLAAVLVTISGWLALMPALFAMSRVAGMACQWHDAHFTSYTFFGHESVTAAWSAAGLPVAPRWFTAGNKHSRQLTAMVASYK